MISWKNLDTEAQLTEIINQSHEKAVAIFKHSTRCSISSMAKRRLERHWDIDEQDLDMYYLDLIRYRSISNQIADTLGAQHQSPQLVLIKNGKAIYNDSHNAISVLDIKDALDNTNTLV